MSPNYTTHSIRLTRVSESPVKLSHLRESPRIDRPKRIHRRHLLRKVPEGVERQFHSATRALGEFAAARLATGDEIRFLRNVELTSPGRQSTASSVGEPSVAMKDDVVFYTGNWYAAVSIDGGQTFSFIDPSREFLNANPPGSDFCCDQVVQYIPSIDTFVWLMQYGPDSGNNVQRFAFAKTRDVRDGGGGSEWKIFDLTTQAVDSPGAFMDFPDLALGPEHLYMTTNLFGPGDTVGSAVVRIPFAGIESGDVNARVFKSTDFQSFRVAQNTGTTAFFAAHRNTSTLEVFSWPDNSNQPTSKSVGVARWIGGNSGFHSRTPDGGRWLDRADPRLTGATQAGNELWFAWGVDSPSNQRQQPFIQIARINAADVTLMENINIFDENSATCYGGLSTNSEGEVGISYMLGGGDKQPTHRVGILTNARQDLLVAEGSRGTSDGQWGDYLTVRRAFLNGNDKLFAAAGFVMEGDGNGSNRDATPHFVIFGRARNVAADATVTAPPAAPAEGPFTDIDTLPVVSPATARKILQAAQQPHALARPEDLPRLRFVQPEKITKPGVQRWPVKTGQDPDVAKVGKNIIGGVDLGTGIVPVTIEELIRIRRPANMTPADKVFPAFQEKRSEPLEFVVWQIEGDIIVVKLEDDGDYHLVVQGASGDTMIAEVPTPTKLFIGNSPWLDNIKAARSAVDQKLLKHLAPQDFVPFDGVLVPRGSFSTEPAQAFSAVLPQSFVTTAEGQEHTMPAFQAKVKPTPARITGVGFFDVVHGQTGVAQLNGVEIHPTLKIQWL